MVDPERVRRRRANGESILWSAGKYPIAVLLMVVLANWSRVLAWDAGARLFGVP